MHCSQVTLCPSTYAQACLPLLAANLATTPASQYKSRVQAIHSCERSTAASTMHTWRTARPPGGAAPWHAMRAFYGP